jgi:hypothetical protein
MYRFEGHQLIHFGVVIVLAGLAFVIWAAASGTGWLYGGGAGVAVVGAVQILIGAEHLRHEANAPADSQDDGTDATDGTGERTEDAESSADAERNDG